jgi:hypothetical protein
MKTGVGEKPSWLKPRTAAVRACASGIKLGAGAGKGKSAALIQHSFKAKIPAPGLTITFLVRRFNFPAVLTDVWTDEVLAIV